MALDTGYLLPSAHLVTDGFFETYKGVVELTKGGKCEAYVKLLGNKALANEIICTLLGQSADLPIPKGYLVHVSATDYPDSHFLKGNRIQETIAYGSESANAVSFTRHFKLQGEEDEALAYKELFPKWNGWRDTVTFDEWLANADRNPGNLLLGANKEIWLIDHTHAFKGPQWSRDGLTPGAYTVNRVAKHAERFLSRSEKNELGQYVHKLAEKLRNLAIPEIIDRANAGELLDPEDAAALKAFLTKRIDQLPGKISQHIDTKDMFSDEPL
jgi:hypothetical protein